MIRSFIHVLPDYVHLGDIIFIYNKTKNISVFIKIYNSSTNAMLVMSSFSLMHTKYYLQNSSVYFDMPDDSNVEYINNYICTNEYYDTPSVFDKLYHNFRRYFSDSLHELLTKHKGML